uniref:Uncharacterized protein n=1 Tax=viral metagenome TaxID=1070528 RepID=A0A6H2A5H6_9ZZZZ
MNKSMPCNFSFYFRGILWTGFNAWYSAPGIIAYWDAYRMSSGLRIERLFGPEEIRNQ